MPVRWQRFLAVACLGGCALLPAIVARGQDLVGVDFTSGRVYRLPTTGGPPTAIAETNINSLSALELFLDGNYYGYSVFGDVLYRFHPTTYAPTTVGPITGAGGMFEGSLVQSPTGDVYAVNGNDASSARLLRLNVATGGATVVGTMPGREIDINGLAWRSDRMLVGLDRPGNRLVTIDPETATVSTLASLPFTVGALGGMTAIGSTGYFVTAGPGASLPGSNGLYSFDLFTGQHTLVRNLSPDIGAAGIGGLAVLVPEPAAAGALLLCAGPALRLRRAR